MRHDTRQVFPRVRVAWHASLPAFPTSSEITKMHTNLVSSALLAAVLACSPLAIGVAHAQAVGASTATPRQQAHPNPAHGMHHMHHMGRMHYHAYDRRLIKQLDLTDAQRTQLQQWMRQDHAKARAGMKALNGKRMALHNATPGTAAYQRATSELAEASANAARERVMHAAAQRSRFYGMLTPAQRSKLAELRTQHQAQMEKARKAYGKRGAPAPASSSSH